MKKVIIASVLAIALASCGRTTTQCPLEGFRMQFIGYDSSEVDSVMLYRYTKGSNFSSLVDSTIIVLGVQGQKVDDSTFEFSGFNLNEDYSNISEWPYDFKIKNLYDGKMASITDIQNQINTTTHGMLADVGTNHCISPTSSFMQDGVLYSNIGYGKIHK